MNLVESGFYYLADAQGSIRLLRNSISQLKASYSYDAYGSAQCTMPGGPTECEASTPFGYTGQYQDQESGLLYLRARYYDPATEQFLTRDPLEQKTGQPYVYAYGNPVNYTDPAGLEGQLPSKVGPQGNVSSVARVARFFRNAPVGSFLGKYSRVKGHHIHAKAAWVDKSGKALANYDPDEALTLSPQYMQSRGWNHSAMSIHQGQEFRELAKSGKWNSWQEHNRIAVEALVKGNVPWREARSLVALSLWNLRDQKVRRPERIPYGP